MLVRRDKSRSLRTAISVVAAAFLFTACASTPSDSEQASANPENPSDAALLLDDSSAPVATEVSDAGAFADLEAGKEKLAATDPEPTAAASAVAASDDGSPYYNSIGGESIRRVAHTLYSDKGWAAKLLEKNPELKGIKKLAAEQKVYFDMDVAKPEPTYLTKDLLDRYASQLAQRLTASVDEKGISKTTVTLNPGETLQELSKRLYGTHRYWTEIFLVNHDKIQNYDKVKSGITLTVYDRGTAMAAASTEPVAQVPPPVQEPAPVPVVEAQPTPIAPEAVAMPTQPAPIEATQPVPAPAPLDPIPETPPAPVAAVEPIVEAKPEPAVETTKPQPEAAPAPTAEISSSNAVTRPIIYAVLVLLILGGGFYYTRAPKKPKVDMLDITSAESAGRPKLATKDSQKHQIG